VGNDSDALATLTRETQAIWDAKAAFWDERMGEGNAFHRVLVGPSVERLLAPQAGELILDIACGNGQFARHLATLGASVVATDFSPSFLERARARSGAVADRIDYRLVDATDEAALLALGTGQFDGAVCNMANGYDDDRSVAARRARPPQAGRAIGLRRAAPLL
jgi:2-polyprenyl-3-methyl-5-hydroxy-6-metoxy-1,4-benzoquinol methylase